MLQLPMHIHSFLEMTFGNIHNRADAWLEQRMFRSLARTLSLPQEHDGTAPNHLWGRVSGS